MLNVKKSKVIIFIDRIEGDYAVCEFPGEEMRDIHLDVFRSQNFEAHERERFQIEIHDNGEITIICKVHLLPESSKKKLNSKLIRFV